MRRATSRSVKRAFPCASMSESASSSTARRRSPWWYGRSTEGGADAGGGRARGRRRLAGEATAEARTIPRRPPPAGQEGGRIKNVGGGNFPDVAAVIIG